ncbi:14286_t:CDS:1, partial [Racocetra fulgida]
YGDPENSVDDDDSVESSDSVDSHEFDSSYNSDESEELFFQVYSDDFFSNNSGDKVTSNNKNSKRDITAQNNDSVGEGSSLQNNGDRKDNNFPNEESIFQNINRRVVDSDVIRRTTFNNSNDINALQGVIKKNVYSENENILKNTSIKKNGYNYSNRECTLQDDLEHNIGNSTQRIADGCLVDNSEVSSQRSLDLLSDNNSSDFESLQDMLDIEAENEEDFLDEFSDNSIQETSSYKTEYPNNTLNTEINNVSHQQLFLHEDKILEDNLPQAQGGDFFSSSATTHSLVPLSYPLVVINSDTSVPYITPSKSSMPLTPKARSVSSSGERSESPTIELSHDEFMSPPSPLSSKDPQDGEYYDTRKKDKINRSRRSRNSETKSHALRSQSVKFQGSSNKQSRQGRHQFDHTRIKKNGMPLVCRNCNTTFTDSKRLREHFRTHVGERPFVCKIKGCDKTYTRASQLKAHEKTHST